MHDDRDRALRAHLQKLLSWEDAHATFEAATKGVKPALRGRIPEAQSHSPWQLLEHLRRTQNDILEFCRNPGYVELKHPDDYWPPSAAPPHEKDWKESVAAYESDRKALQALAADPAIDLLDRIPHGTGQTYLRELLLVADHNAYHIGQLVAARIALGIWP